MEFCATRKGCVRGSGRCTQDLRGLRGEAEHAGVAFDPFLSNGCISFSDVVCNVLCLRKSAAH